MPCTGRMTMRGSVWISLKQVVSGQVGIDQMSGPVGVTDVLVQTAQSSMTSFFLLIAFISINLGVMNLLPLPHWTADGCCSVLIELLRAGRFRENTKAIFISADSPF